VQEAPARAQPAIVLDRVFEIAREIEHARRGAQGPQPLQHAVTGHAGQEQVGDHERDGAPVADADGERLVQIPRAEHVVAVQLQDLGDQVTHAGLRLQHQHGGGGGRRRRRLLDDVVPRQVDREGGAAAHVAGRLHVAAALADEGEDRGQAQPRPAAGRLRREVRLEGARERGGVHAGAGVGDAHHHRAQRAGRALLEIDVGGLDGDAPAGGHRVARVEQQVHQRLLELPHVHLDAAQARLQLERDLHLLAQQRGQRAHHAGRHRVEVERGRHRRRRLAGRQHVLREVEAPHRGLADGLGARAQRVGRVHALEHQLAVAADDGQDVAEVVRDAAGQPAHRLQAARLVQLLVQPPPALALLLELGAETLDLGQRFRERRLPLHRRVSAGGEEVT